MTLKSLGTHIAFGALTATLGLVAGMTLYRNADRPETKAVAGGELPHNHPATDDASGRIETLRQMVAQSPENAEYRTQLGNIYYDIGDYQKAAEQYQQSLRLRPRNPSVETDLATCLHYMGQNDKSLEILDKVLEYSPGFDQAMINKGIVLSEGKKDVRGGIAVWEEFLRIRPEYRQRAELERRISTLKSSLQ